MKNISIKLIATFFSCLMMFVSSAEYINTSSYELDKVSNSDKIFDRTVYDGTDLNENEIKNLNVESVNNYLSSFYKSLNTQSISEEIQENRKEYEFLKSTSALLKKSAEFELFNITKDWIGESSKKEILELENGAEFYVIFDYSLQMVKMNDSSLIEKSGSHPGDCLFNLLTYSAGGATIGSWFPVIGTLTGGIVGFIIASETEACKG
jgi:hypothetical protein